MHKQLNKLPFTIAINIWSKSEIIYTHFEDTTYSSYIENTTTWDNIFDNNNRYWIHMAQTFHPSAVEWDVKHNRITLNYVLGEKINKKG